jgi:predicted  nucleic acid-binding Zn-ribbon protein
MADYITQEQLDKFTADLEKYVVDTMANEEIEFAGAIKKYVETKLAELESSIVNSEEWDKVKGTINALVQVFDSDESGTLTPEEVLGKIGELKATIDGVADRVTNVETSVGDINKTIGGIQTDITNVKDSIAANTQAIADAKSALETEIEDSVTAAKTELGQTVDTKIADLDQKVSDNTNVIFNAIQDAMLSAFENAKSTVCDRMNNVRDVFGIPTVDCSASTDNSADNSGDGATL